MTTSIEDVYEQGFLRPLKLLETIEGTMVATVLLEPAEAGLDVLK